MQEETGVPRENLRDQEWMGNQTNLWSMWRSKGLNLVRSGEGRVFDHQPNFATWRKDINMLSNYTGQKEIRVKNILW